MKAAVYEEVIHICHARNSEAHYAGCTESYYSIRFSLKGDDF